MEKMANELPFNIDPQTVTRFGVGGALTGAGAAAALSLAHMLRQARKNREQTETTETDENTIVLTLPKRASSPVNEEEGIQYDEMPVAEEDDNRADRSESTVENPKGMVTSPKAGKRRVKGKKIKTDYPRLCTMESRNNQLRYIDGQFGMKTANWPTLTTSLLAAGGGGVLGYQLVNKVYQARRIKQREAELEQARQEYLDMLKGASPLQDVFHLSEEKQADRKAFSPVDYPMGLFALASLLGAGGTAFLTKKVLDQYNADSVVPESPKLQRIVFRTEGAAKEASDDGRNVQASFEASVGIYLDVVEGEQNVLSAPGVVKAAQAADVKVCDLYKMAGEDYSSLMATLEANPDLRTLIQRATMEQHPLLKYFKWSARLPGIRGMLDNKLYEGVEKAVLPQPEAPAAVKAAGLPTPDVKAIMSSFYGSELAEATKSNKQRKVQEQQKRDEEDADPDNKLKGMQLIADDPNALAFVEANREQILKALQSLSGSGQI
jgi:hypothetical protein